jgi:hypothetical protein
MPKSQGSRDKLEAKQLSGELVKLIRRAILPGIQVATNTESKQICAETDRPVAEISAKADEWSKTEAGKAFQHRYELQAACFDRLIELPVLTEIKKKVRLNDDGRRHPLTDEEWEDFRKFIAETPDEYEEYAARTGCARCSHCSTIWIPGRKLNEAVDSRGKRSRKNGQIASLPPSPSYSTFRLTLIRKSRERR